MSRILPIQTLSDPALDVYLRMTEAQLKNKKEKEKGLFIAESPKVILTALEAGYEPLSLLVPTEHLKTLAASVVAAVGEAPVYTAELSLLSQLTGYSLTRGVLCAMKRKPLPTLDSVLAGARRIAVLDGIADSSNMGAIFRSAAALGMDALVCTATCCDPLLRRSVRVSMGTVFQLPWSVAESVEEIKSRGFALAAMALRHNSLSPEDPRLQREEKLAVVLGSEGWGLGEDVLSLCDYTVKIPMAHGVDSLNVNAAAAVIFWQLRPKES